MSDTITKWNEMEEDRKRSLYPGDIKITENPAPSSDKYVQQIKEKFESRSQVGIKKYGTTLERGDLTSEQWLTHLEEELMDSLLYLQVLKDKLK